MILNLQEIHNYIWSNSDTFFGECINKLPEQDRTATYIRFAMFDVAEAQVVLLDWQSGEEDDDEWFRTVINQSLTQCYTELVAALGCDYIYLTPELDTEEGYDSPGALTPLDLISYLCGMALYDYQARGNIPHVPWQYYIYHALGAIAKFPGLDVVGELKRQVGH